MKPCLSRDLLRSRFFKPHQLILDETLQGGHICPTLSLLTSAQFHALPLVILETRSAPRASEGSGGVPGGASGWGPRAEGPQIQTLGGSGHLHILSRLRELFSGLRALADWVP